MKDSHYHNTVSLFDKWASRYSQKYMDVNLYRESLNFFLEKIKAPNASLLDVACGPGNLTRFIMESLPDTTILGVDLSSEMIKIAKEKNPSSRFLVHDAMDLTNLNQKFDGVICGFLLPYLNNTETQWFLSQVQYVLLSDGFLYLSTIKGNPELPSYIPATDDDGTQLCTNFYNMNTLEILLKNANLEVVADYEVSYVHDNGIPTTDICLIAKRK